ncbi:hypothetical protein [Sewage-associated circular DNA virus-29]|uniref:Uncharacterized protein n=1 Tax=Sewage-associated circular DNA virus-29 TaxID=1592096 RepID=A0A0B4UFZ2_9VIRU|nr:hypothetical protein [Sewage-associated circular DNA virus-29]AJD07552.1 hypothetical protein [Sewage-associated circular DNA virus-29]
MFNYQRFQQDERELKFCYTNIGVSSLSWVGQRFPVNRIPRGYDNVNQRTGRVITQHFCKLRGFLQLQKTEDIPWTGPNGDFSPSQITRLMIIEDLQPTGAGFTLTDLFQETPSQYALPSDFKFSNINRFRIWFDKSYPFDAFAYKTGVIEGFVNRTIYWIDEDIDLHGLQTVYGASPGVDILTSSLTFVAVSTANTPPVGGTQNGTSGSFRCTIGFYDD